MFNIIKKYRREFFYTVVLFIVWEMAQIPEILGLPRVYFIYAILGGILVFIWTISSYIQYASHDVSRFTDVLIKIQLRERFFLYFVLPIFLFFLATFYLYVNKTILLNQLLILFTTTIYFLFFVHIRSSYEKVFSIAKYTRVIINFVDIVIFYLMISILVMYGTRNDIRFAGIILTGAFLLSHQLMLHRQRSRISIFILILSLIVLAAASLFFINISYLLFPLVMTLVFYVIVSWWNIRLDGYTSYEEYLPPLLFALMGFIIIVSF